MAVVEQAGDPTRSGRCEREEEVEGGEEVEGVIGAGVVGEVARRRRRAGLVEPWRERKEIRRRSVSHTFSFIQPHSQAHLATF